VRRIAKRDALYRRLLAVSDCVAIVSSIAAATTVDSASLRWAALALVPGMVLLAKLLGLYDRDQNRLHKETLGEAPRVFSAATIATLVAYLCQGILISGTLDQLGVLTLWGSLALTLFCGRAITRYALTRVSATERCLIVGDRLTASMLARKFDVQGINAAVVGVLKDDPVEHMAWTPELTARLEAAISEYDVDRVILTSEDWRSDEILHAIDDLKASGVRVSVLPPVSRLATLSFELDQLPGIALLGIQSFGISRSSMFVKRVFDASCAAIALIVLAPVMGLIALAIKLDSAGPVFFRQRRIGRDGESFRLLKFRSMVVGADDLKPELVHLNESNGLFKITHDPRITRVGGILRNWSLDELPQLFNVLRGEMSLVGPRPLIPEEDRMIQGAYRRRLEIAPGMTGHWQILGSWRVPLDEMVTLDYLYVANWSLWRDIKLLAQTIPYVLARRGT